MAKLAEEKIKYNSMQTELVVISAIIGTLIIGRGIWQYVSHPSAKTRRSSSNSTRSSRNSAVERAEKVEKYKAFQRAHNRVRVNEYGEIDNDEDPRKQYENIRQQTRRR